MKDFIKNYIDEYSKTQYESTDHKTTTEMSLSNWKCLTWYTTLFWLSMMHDCPNFWFWEWFLPAPADRSSRQCWLGTPSRLACLPVSNLVKQDIQNINIALCNIVYKQFWPIFSANFLLILNGYIQNWANIHSFITLNYQEPILG